MSVMQMSARAPQRRDGGTAPPMQSEAEVPGEIKVWLFVSVVPATFAAVILALVLLLP